MMEALISCLVTVNKYMHMTQVITLTLYKCILSKYIMLWLDFIKCVGNLAIPGYILYI